MHSSLLATQMFSESPGKLDTSSVFRILAIGFTSTHEYLNKHLHAPFWQIETSEGELNCRVVSKWGQVT